MNRWKASAIHFAVSALVIGTVAAAAIWLWYPPGLFESAKAGKLLVTLAAVDVVLGPLLTLVVYKQGKKSLKFDLTIIALLQLAALGYGLHAVWQSRPVYLVAAKDRFQLVFANEIDPDDLQWASPEFQKLPKFGPRIIASVMPKAGERQFQAILSALNGKDVYLIPSQHVPYEQEASKLLARSMPATDLLGSLGADDRAALDRAIASSGHAANDLVVVPIDSVRGSATMLLMAKDASVVGPVGVDPWSAFIARELTRQESDQKRHAPEEK